MDFIPSGPSDNDGVRYYITKTENDQAYVIKFGGYGWGIKLSDAKFELSDYNDTRQYRLSINETNPTLDVKDDMIVYPFSSGDRPVWDNTTNETITNESSLVDYAGCYIAYIDKNNDNKVGPGDEIWVYKDYNDDGIDDVKSRYTLTILDEEDMVIVKKQL